MKTNETKKKLEAEVVSNKMTKTIKVSVVVPTARPKYKKVIYRKKYYLVHSEKQHEIGDKVTIMQSRPYSKNVKWTVIN